MQKKCLYCDNEFLAIRKSKKYCSDNCKQMSYFTRNGLVLSGTATILNNQTIEQNELDFRKKEEDTVKYGEKDVIVKDVKHQELLNVKSDNSMYEEPLVIKDLLEDFTKQINFSLSETIKTLREEFTVKYNSLQSQLYLTVKENDKTVSVKYNNPLPEKLNCLELLDDESEDNKKELNEGSELKNQNKNSNEFDKENIQLKATEKEMQTNNLSKGQFDKVHVSNDKKVIEQTNSEQEEDIDDNYEWIESKFLKKIEQNYSQSRAAVHFLNPHRYYDLMDIPTVEWVNIRLRCLIESLIKASNYNTIDRRTLFFLADAFTRLNNSKSFKKLPPNYPYIEMIQEYAHKLKVVAQANKNTERIKIKLDADKKAFLISVAFILARHVPKVKFSELDFIEDFLFMDKTEEKWNENKTKKYKPNSWQLRYQALKRLGKLKNAA